METLAWLVLILPLAGCVTIALTFRVLPERLAGVIGTGAIFAACAIAWALSSAGMIPSTLASRQKAFSASSSVMLKYSTRPVSFQ